MNCDVNYSNSIVRKKLNNEYLYAMFTLEERSMIVPGNYGDKLFLLTTGQYKNYFKNGCLFCNTSACYKSMLDGKISNQVLNNNTVIYYITLYEYNYSSASCSISSNGSSSATYPIQPAMWFRIKRSN